MLLKDNKLFELPSFSGGSSSGLDRLAIPHAKLILSKALQRDDNGNIEFICRATDGVEEKRGSIQFSQDDRAKKDILCSWFCRQIGKNIEAIYSSEFTFENYI